MTLKLNSAGICFLFSVTLYHVAWCDQLNKMLSEFYFPWCDCGNRLQGGSFPFNRARRFRADVIDDTVHALNFGNDAAGHTRQHLVRQPRPISRHAIHARNGANRNHALVSALVAHHSHARNGARPPPPPRSNGAAAPESPPTRTGKIPPAAILHREFDRPRAECA